MGFISKYAHMYVSAAGLTLRIAFFGIIFSLILGAFCSMVQYFKIPVIRRIVGVYIELSRNTPLLVQLYFIYYGLPKIGISLSGEMCAIIGLIFLGGSYMSDNALHSFPAGSGNIRACPVRKHHLYDQGNISSQRHRCS